MIDIFHLFHVLHVLPNYSMFSYLRWQDGTTWGAQLPVEEPPSVFFTVNDLPAVVSGVLVLDSGVPEIPYAIQLNGPEEYTE